MVGKQLTSIHVLSGRYTKKSIENLSKPVGEEVVEIDVKGKLIVIYFRNCAILSTAGMSGEWVVEPVERKFKRIELKVKDSEGAESTFVFADQRNFGTFKVVKLSEADAKLMELGPDIMNGDEAPPTFFQRVKRFGGCQTLAEGIMDQRIAAGVGNYIRAEAMYIADEHPFQPITSLPEERLAKVWKAAHQVAHEAFRLQHEYRDLCYRRERTDEGYAVSSASDRNGRTVWYVSEHSRPWRKL